MSSSSETLASPDDYDPRRQQIAMFLYDVGLVERGVATFAQLPVPLSEAEESVFIYPENVGEVDVRVREELASTFPDLSLLGHSID